MVVVVAGAAPAGAQRHEGVATAPDGARLYYTIIGSGNPTIVVPGGLFLARDLAPLGRIGRVVFYDMRNRGRSEPIIDSARISIDADVGDLDVIRQAVHAEQIAVVGWSYLGMMVMRYAIAHPRRVTRIVQLAPLARAFGEQFPDDLVAHDSVAIPDAAAVARLDSARARGLDTANAREFCELDYVVNRPRLVGQATAAARVPDPCDMPNEWPAALTRHFRLLFTSIARSDPGPWARYEDLRIPVLTIHGTQDRNAPYGGGLEWAHHLKNGRVLIVRGAAHMLWLDEPQIVLPAMQRFLGGAWPAKAIRVPAQSPGAATPVGVWRGTSLCTVRPSACNNEIVVYRITRATTSDNVSIDARKIVSGREEEMGVLACHAATSGAQVTCTMPNGVWHFTIRGDSLVGELRLLDNTKFRDVRTSRSR